jgi:hypothetical protein
MISLRQRLQRLPILGAGVVAGLVLALMVWRRGGIEPAFIILITVLPFVLAASTGIAKTTTA